MAKNFMHIPFLTIHQSVFMVNYIAWNYIEEKNQLLHTKQGYLHLLHALDESNSNIALVNIINVSMP